MMAVPRRSQRAAGAEADTQSSVATPEPSNAATPEPLNGATPEPTKGATPEPTNGASSDAETALVPVLPEPAPLAALPAGPQPKADPGLYAVLGLDPSVSDSEIQTTYRRQAARLMRSSSDDFQALKQLNVAYEVLGNPARRVDYDRMRLTQSLVTTAPTPIRLGAKQPARATHRRRPRPAVIPRYAGLGDVLVVLSVVGLAVVAGILLVPRLSVNLSALNALQNVLPISNSSRHVIDATVTAVPTAAPTATPLPGVAARFSGTNVSVSNPTPAQNSLENVVLRLRRDGKPAANFDVWAIVKYRTVEERWPAAGALKTDTNGAATISFNVGAATLNYPVNVNVFVQADDQQLTWSTSFTPH